MAKKHRRKYILLVKISVLQLHDNRLNYIMNFEYHFQTAIINSSLDIFVGIFSMKKKLKKNSKKTKKKTH